MANIEELRRQIDTVEDMQSIVRVMKTLSAVSIQQYQHAARRLRLYQEVVDRSLQAVLMASDVTIAAEADPEPRQGLIVFGSDQGLCGRFNEVVVDRARHWLRQHEGGEEEIPVLAVGLRCAARLKAEGIRPDTIFPQAGSVSGLSQMAQSILLTLDAWRHERGTEKVDTVFNFEAGRRGLEARDETVLPLDPSELRRIAGRGWPSHQRPAFDGERDTVFSALVRERLYSMLMRAGAESLAAEHATRLSAMQSAERNISEKAVELQGSYRRERQDQITNELMDIVLAYECVSHGDTP